MRALWLFIKFLMALTIALIGAMFAMENSQQLSVNFGLVNSPELSLGLWLILFLATGTVLGIFASSLIIASYRRKLARATKKD
jgi:lipopolysaccharide assembly protein A